MRAIRCFARLDAITCAKNSAYSVRSSVNERAAACSSAASAELSAWQKAKAREVRKRAAVRG